MSVRCRWAFLEAGVEGIMRNLREGVDMVTVRGAMANLRLMNTDVESAVYGYIYVRNRTPKITSC